MEAVENSINSRDYTPWRNLSRQLAAELEEANRRAESAERQLAEQIERRVCAEDVARQAETKLARYREKYGELE